MGARQPEVSAGRCWEIGAGETPPNVDTSFGRFLVGPEGCDVSDSTRQLMTAPACVPKVVDSRVD
jgi:hypothetical protein